MLALRGTFSARSSTATSWPGRTYKYWAHGRDLRRCDAPQIRTRDGDRHALRVRTRRFRGGGSWYALVSGGGLASPGPFVGAKRIRCLAVKALTLRLGAYGLRSWWYTYDVWGEWKIGARVGEERINKSMV